MNNFNEVLTEVSLFAGVSMEDLNSMLNCLYPVIKKYKKNETIFMAGEEASKVGIVLSGRVHIIKEDILGNSNILTEICKGQLFGEVFSCAKVTKIPITAISISESEILFIDYKRIISTCSSACRFHTRLVENMLSIIASKNILLTQKIEHISKRSIRDKIMSYLSSQAQNNLSNSFIIPFNRQQLADYLCTDRSALSKELCKLRDEGILKFEKNKFELFL